jgi:hypothetical protein
VLLDASSPADALISQAEKSLVISGGRVVVENRRATIWNE